MKSVMEMAFRDLMVKERAKGERIWKENDIRKVIVVSLWDISEARKENFYKKMEMEVRL
jgi:predicted nucleotidyltransferase